MSKITEKTVRKIIREAIKQRLGLTEAVEVESKESHEISAAANLLLKAIKAFEDEGLPDIPSELSTALKSASVVLNNMSDNPGRYKGGASASVKDESGSLEQNVDRTA